MVHKDIVDLINEVQKDLEDIMFGSVEFYVQDGKVTQKTIRKITKTDISKSSRQEEGSEEKPGFQAQSQNGIKGKIHIKIGS